MTPNTPTKMTAQTIITIQCSQAMSWAICVTPSGMFNCLTLGPPGMSCTCAQAEPSVKSMVKPSKPRDFFIQTSNPVCAHAIVDFYQAYETKDPRVRSILMGDRIKIRRASSNFLFWLYLILGDYSELKLNPT